MDEIFQKLNLANNLWQTQKCRHQKFFEATDVWLYPATGEIDVDSQTVQESNLKTWLADEVRGSDSQARFLLQRFVWVEIDVKGREIMLDSSIGKTLIKSFKLSLANGYLTSATSGITAFPPSPSENGEVSTFALGHAPKIAATWSQEHFTSWLGRPATTRSMVFMAKESIEATQGFLKKSWTASLYHNNMFPAFLLAIQMGMEISDSQRKDIEKVHKIERSTGFHTFTHRAEGDIIKDSGKLVVFTSGLAAKLASMERNSKVLRMLLDFVASTIDQKSAAMKTFEKQEEDDQWLRAKKESRELLSHHISVLRNRLAMLDLETDYLTKRVKMQTESLFHIIASEDNITGFKMAQSSERIALSSYQIARSTYRDSSSMKTLAIVTMFFLPGNFVSAMFSMPMFEWTEINPTSSYIGVGLLPQFSLYWAITIPLTLVTFMLYFGWLWRLKRDLAESTPEENLTRFKYEQEQNSEEAFARRLDRKRREHTNDMATPPQGISHDLSRFAAEKLFNKSEA